MAKSTVTETKTTVVAPAATGPSSYEVPGFVCSILSLIPLPVIGLILSILGIIFSMRQRKVMNTPMATAGLILGIVGLVLQILLLTYAILVIYAYRSAPVYV
jgi:membrane-bound ClpP family serine protease